MQQVLQTLSKAHGASGFLLLYGGSVADETDLRLLFDGLEATVVEPGSLDEALAQAGPLLVRAASRLMRLLLTGRRLA